MAEAIVAHHGLPPIKAQFEFEFVFVVSFPVSIQHFVKLKWTNNLKILILTRNAFKRNILWICNLSVIS